MSTGDMAVPPERELVLASASPRRHRLLAEAGLDFRIVPADVDETMDLTLDAGPVAEDLALRKARAVAAREGCRDAIILGSDTVVVLGEDRTADRRFLEKAGGPGEARAMLQALSGSRHRVITGVALVDAKSGAELRGHEVTYVSMRELTSSELEAYVASGEWEGKAGAYAIQETADRFVTGLEGGGFDNVVGLPVALTLGLLRSMDPGFRAGSGA